MRAVILPLAAGFFILIGIATPAAAHMGAKGVVKERMDAMASMGKTMKSLNTMAQGKVPYDHKAVARAGHLMRGHAEKMPALFPKGPIHPPSDARPEIWIDRAGFEKLAGDLAAEATRLATIGADGNGRVLARHFQRVGRICSACHKTFRAKKQAR